MISYNINNVERIIEMKDENDVRTWKGNPHRRRLLDKPISCSLNKSRKSDVSVPPGAAADSGSRSRH